MKTVPRCRDYPAPARRSPAPAPAAPQPAPGTNPGGPRPLSPRFAAVAAALYLRALARRPARRRLANSRRAPAATRQTVYGEMAARRFRRLMSHHPLPPGIRESYRAGCSNHMTRNAIPAGAAFDAFCRRWL